MRMTIADFKELLSVQQDEDQYKKNLVDTCSSVRTDLIFNLKYLSKKLKFSFPYTFKQSAEKKYVPKL